MRLFGNFMKHLDKHDELRVELFDGQIIDIEPTNDSEEEFAYECKAENVQFVDAEDAVIWVMEQIEDDLDVLSWGTIDFDHNPDNEET